jgi:hypothetical protein
VEDGTHAGHGVVQFEVIVVVQGESGNPVPRLIRLSRLHAQGFERVGKAHVR